MTLLAQLTRYKSFKNKLYKTYQAGWTGLCRVPQWTSSTSSSCKWTTSSASTASAPASPSPSTTKCATWWPNPTPPASPSPCTSPTSSPAPPSSTSSPWTTCRCPSPSSPPSTWTGCSERSRTTTACRRRARGEYFQRWGFPPDRAGTSASVWGGPGEVWTCNVLIGF